DLGSLFGLGPLLPAGAEDASLVGAVPDAGIVLAEYEGPEGYPVRFVHLLVDYREVRTVFSFDGEDGVWRAFSAGAPSWVNSLTELDPGQSIYIFFNPLAS